MDLDRERLLERMVQLTRDLVLIESTDARPEERARCFQLIRNHLEQGPGVRLVRHENRSYESLVVVPEGVDRPEVLFCGHLDVVEHSQPDSYRSELRDGRIHGPGAGDMKGQLAILVELFKQLQRERPGLPIGLAITSDEERGGESGVRFLVEEAGLDCGAAVIPDGGSLTDVTIEEKGILHLRIRAEGESAHAARPWLGRNPVDALLGALSALKADFDARVPPGFEPADQTSHWFPTLAVTILETPNDSPNRIPDMAEAVVDVRFPPPDTVDSMFVRILGSLPPGVTVDPIVTAEPTHLSPDPRFIEITGEVAGEEARVVRACGGSDARFFCARGIPVMLSRPLVGNLHGRDEWIEIESMLAYFEICRRYTRARLG
ncbi:MAG: M20/M25/M40 family metallo-hydrolase [Akkermansiaceae bacterium]|nr:M20/M25/M40 family metallo-hydrolase [Akkermansiaceae bacterium]